MGSEGTKTSRVYEAMKDEIVYCRLRPGDMIIESELAERFGTSKTPVRNALNRLALEGMVDILPRRGSVVRYITIRDAQDVYLLRQLLEPEAAALAAERASKDDVARLEQLDACWSTAEADPSIHDRLHTAVAEAARVPRLTSIIAGLHTQVQWFLQAQAMYSGRLPPKHHHTEVIDAIRAGDSEAARAITKRTLATSFELIIDFIAAEHTSSSAGGRNRSSIPLVPGELGS